MSEGWRRSFPDVGMAVLLMALLLGIQVACGVMIGLGQLAAHGFAAAKGSFPPIPPVAVLLVNVVAFAVTLGWAGWANRGRNREVWQGGCAGGLSWVAVLAAVPGFSAVVVTLSNPLVALLRLLPGYNPNNDLLAELMDVGRHPFVSVATVVVLAPIAEEALFRGYILRGLAERLRPGWALGLSTLLFVVSHANPAQVPVSAGIGLVCGWVFLRTRSLALCIAVHLANNALALFADRLPFTVDGFNGPGEAGVLPPWWFVLAGAGTLALALAAFAWASRGRLVPPPLPAAGMAEPPVLPERLGAVVTEPPPLPTDTLP